MIIIIAIIIIIIIIIYMIFNYYYLFKSGQEAALRVCNRFFLSRKDKSGKTENISASEVVAPITVGKGLVHEIFIF